MKTIKSICLITFLALLLSECGKNEDEKPYIILKDTSGQTLTATNIPVGLNTTFRVYVEIGYERFKDNNIDYDWKIDQGEFTQYSAFDGLNITMLGSYNNLRLEDATLDVTFGDDIVSAGSQVAIRIRDRKNLSRTLTLIVE